MSGAKQAGGSRSQANPSTPESSAEKPNGPPLVLLDKTNFSAFVLGATHFLVKDHPLTIRLLETGVQYTEPKPTAQDIDDRIELPDGIPEMSSALLATARKDAALAMNKERYQRERERRDKNYNLFLALWALFSDTIKSEVRTDPKYAAALLTQDPVALWTIVRVTYGGIILPGEVAVVDDNLATAHHKAGVRLVQDKNEDFTTYHERCVAYYKGSERLKIAVPTDKQQSLLFLQGLLPKHKHIYETLANTDAIPLDLPKALQKVIKWEGKESTAPTLKDDGKLNDAIFALASKILKERMKPPSTPKKADTKTTPSAASTPSPRNKPRVACHNCAGDDHPWFRCDKPLSPALLKLQATHEAGRTPRGDKKQERVAKAKPAKSVPHAGTYAVDEPVPGFDSDYEDTSVGYMADFVGMIMIDEPSEVRHRSPTRRPADERVFAIDYTAMYGHLIDGFDIHSDDVACSGMSQRTNLGAGCFSVFDARSDHWYPGSHESSGDGYTYRPKDQDEGVPCHKFKNGDIIVVTWPPSRYHSHNTVHHTIEVCYEGYWRRLKNMPFGLVKHHHLRFKSDDNDCKLYHTFSEATPQSYQQWLRKIHSPSRTEPWPTTAITGDTGHHIEFKQQPGKEHVWPRGNPTSNQHVCGDIASKCGYDHTICHHPDSPFVYIRHEPRVADHRAPYHPAPGYQTQEELIAEIGISTFYHRYLDQDPTCPCISCTGDNGVPYRVLERAYNTGTAHNCLAAWRIEAAKPSAKPLTESTRWKERACQVQPVPLAWLRRQPSPPHQASSALVLTTTTPPQSSRMSLKPTTTCADVLRDWDSIN